MSFFILGIPRSRTAWLANFMTYGKTFCFHEGVNGCRSMEEYRTKLSGRGDSGTGLMLLDLDTYFPNAKKLIIECEPDRASEFIEETYGEDGALALFLKERLDQIDGMRVEYHDINDRLQEIWEYLSDEPYDAERGDMLKKLNVQVHDPFDLDHAAARELFNA